MLIFFLRFYSISERHFSCVVRDAQFWSRKLLEVHEFNTGLHHPMTGKHSLPAVK